MCDASELLLISWLGESVYMNMLQLLSNDVAIPIVCLLWSESVDEFGNFSPRFALFSHIEGFFSNQ